MSDEQPLLTAINDFCKAWPNAEYGPAHVVLSDYNLEDEFIESALAALRDAPMAEDERQATTKFLRALLLLPEGYRCLDGDKL